MLKASFMICATLSLCFSVKLSHAQTGAARLVPFYTFVQETRAANANDFVGRSTSKVKDAASFEEMRQHILSLYEGVKVTHSYVSGSQTFDCVPVNEQPAVRGSGKGKIASEPPPGAGSSEPPRPQQKADSAHPSGNDAACEAHTIPMRRVTLDQLSRFRTLQDFFRK